jgi:hypothetical protein
MEKGVAENKWFTFTVHKKPFHSRKQTCDRCNICKTDSKLLIKLQNEL